MEVDTDTIIAFMSFLVGSYIFISKNVKFEMPNREKVLEKMKKEKDAENQKKQKEAEAKAEGLMNKLFGMKKEVKKDKEDIETVNRLRKKKEKELEELQKKREKKEKKEEEFKQKQKEEEDRIEKILKKTLRGRNQTLRPERVNAIVLRKTPKPKNTKPKTDDFANIIKGLTNASDKLKQTQIKK